MKRREEREMFQSVRRFMVTPAANDVEFDCTEEVELMGYMVLAYGG